VTSLRPRQSPLDLGIGVARARNIKPGFFENEDLAELGPEAMLLFAGLWTLADREGRLEDRPKRIKAQLFPYFDLDCDGTLEALQDRGFLERYSVAGTRYIQIVNFLKHQNPHVRETPSVIPAPGESGEGTPKASQGSAQHCGFSDSLISDSLIPDSPITDSEAPAARARVYQPQFEDFWNAVVRKEPSKAKAHEAWLKATTKATAGVIHAGLLRWLPVWAATEDKTKIPHITTWLNQERWTVDHPTMPTSSNGATKPEDRRPAIPTLEQVLQPPKSLSDAKRAELAAIFAERRQGR
jgi:hypothetical protein